MYWRIFRIIGQTNNLFLILEKKLEKIFLSFSLKIFVSLLFRKRIKNSTYLLIAKVVEWILEDVLARIWCTRRTLESIAWRSGYGRSIVRRRCNWHLLQLWIFHRSHHVRHCRRVSLHQHICLWNPARCSQMLKYLITQRWRFTSTLIRRPFGKDKRRFCHRITNHYR